MLTLAAGAVLLVESTWGPRLEERYSPGPGEAWSSRCTRELGCDCKRSKQGLFERGPSKDCLKRSKQGLLQRGARERLLKEVQAEIFFERNAKGGECTLVAHGCWTKMLRLLRRCVQWC
jgi:hypothetical protein